MSPPPGCLSLSVLFVAMGEIEDLIIYHLWIPADVLGGNDFPSPTLETWKDLHGTWPSSMSHHCQTLTFRYSKPRDLNLPNRSLMLPSCPDYPRVDSVLLCDWEGTWCIRCEVCRIRTKVHQMPSRLEHSHHPECSLMSH